MECFGTDGFSSSSSSADGMAMVENRSVCGLKIFRMLSQGGCEPNGWINIVEGGAEKSQ